MPRFSQREQTRRAARRVIRTSARITAYSNLLNPSSWSDSALDLAELAAVTLSDERRYFTPRRYRVTYQRQGVYSFTNYFELRRLQPDDFKGVFRMSIADFNKLVEVVTTESEAAGDPFRQHSHGSPARPLYLQVAAGLMSLGAQGGYDNQGRQTHISKGSVVDYANRLIDVLASPTMMSRYLSWASTNQIRDESSADHSIFSGCRGFLDGTYLFLQMKPEQDHEAYFSRKDRYGFNAQIIASADKRILWAGCGHTASCHDSTAWKHSPFYRERTEILLPSEYLLADKAYEIDRHLITPFKQQGQPSASKALFNRTHSHLRIGVEHTIGILKARFPSLRYLPLRIRSDHVGDDHDRVLKWFMACVVLHNFLHERGDAGSWLDATAVILDEQTDVSEGTGAEAVQTSGTQMKRDGERLRERIMQELVLANIA